ncbi:unnamed protein product [Thlaspi arvense]|uniref:RNase H type-1 domain-containing protein n=1 Tax=Thlaspi arvense TaxID=13288 RepID=A0AAU9RUX4_THLAR|nr:unnamed protein product [Thlaspi arvense]
MNLVGIRCGELEKISHVLLHCSFAKEVWETALIRNSLSPNPDWDFNTTWPMLHQLQEITKFSATVYPVEEVVNKDIVGVQKWFEAQSTKIQAPTQTLKRNRVTSSIYISCRTDVVWQSDNKVPGLGWVFIKDQESLIAQHSTIVSLVRSPLMAESLAIREAFEGALRLAFRRIRLESDSS